MNLTTGASCPWSVQSNSSWLSVIGSPSGTGPAAIQFAVGPGPSFPVTCYGSLNIAGVAFSIGQTHTRTAANGIDAFTVWRPSSGTWFVLNSAPTEWFSASSTSSSGASGRHAVAGRLQWRRKTDYAVWRPSTGIWYIIPSGDPGTPILQQWGLPGDVPIGANF